MPTYEYVCKACDHEFERDQRISDPPVKTCPKCKAKQVKRLISRTSFHLKGGGWYSDLYSKPKGGKSDGEASTPAGDSKSDAPSGGAGGAEKSESKPEKKAGKKPAKSASGSGGSGTGGSGSKAAA